MMQTEILKTGNWFVDQLSLYQAANSDKASLKKGFTVRIDEFEIIIADLKNKSAKDPLQHELLLGRRGSGKSTLLKRLEIELEEDPILLEKYVAINLAEEQAGIYRLSDLWFEVLQELSKQFAQPLALPNFDTFESKEAYTRFLYAQIHEILQNKAKKAVLLLDNFERILENLDDEAQLLREILLNYNDLQIIGGSTRMDEHFWQYDQPFYEFFRRHRLVALSFSEIDRLLNYWSEAMQLPKLQNYAHNHRGKIEAIRILTDGLPRTLQFFIQILLYDDSLYGFDYIQKVMDKASPLYQERLNSLTAPQRKIVLEMAFIWEAAATKQLIQVCRMEGKLIASYLKQLSQFGIVETIKTDTKNHLYRLSERFFNMWLIITQGNPDQKRKAKWLTIFLETWYDANEIQNLAQEHSEKIKKGNLAYDKAIVLSKALSQSRFLKIDQRDELIDITLNLPEIAPRNTWDLPEKFEQLKFEIDRYREEGKYDLALEKVQEIENEEDGTKFYMMGYFHYELNQLELTEKYYLQAIEKGYVNAFFNLASLYVSQEKFELAEKYYLKDIAGGNIKAMNNLALLYVNQEKFELAEKYYLKAIDKGDAKIISNLAVLYTIQNKFELAEGYYLQAIEKGYVIALNNLANLYANQDKYELAENYFMQAIEKGDAVAFFNLALLYENQEKFELAESYYLQAIEKGNIDACFNLAVLYENQEKGELAENYYLKAIDNGDLESLLNLTVLYYETNQKKKQALDLIQQRNQAKNKWPKSLALEIIIEIWNNIFEDLEERIDALLTVSKEIDLAWFVQDLLVQSQTQLVFSFFDGEKHGKHLQEKYTLLYYTTLLLLNKTNDNLLLRIPPEVLPTVQDMVSTIKERQAFYES